MAEPMEGEAAQARAVAEGILLEGEETPTQPATLRFITPQQAELTITGALPSGEAHVCRFSNHVNTSPLIGDVLLPDDLALANGGSLPGRDRQLLSDLFPLRCHNGLDAHCGVLFVKTPYFIPLSCFD